MLDVFVSNAYARSHIFQYAQALYSQSGPDPDEQADVAVHRWPWSRPLTHPLPDEATLAMGELSGVAEIGGIAIAFVGEPVGRMVDLSEDGVCRLVVSDAIVG